MADVLLSSRDGPVTTLTLNRPDKLNAFNAMLVEALMEALETACHDDTRLLVVRAKGKGFSGGFDLSAIAGETDASLLTRFVRLELMLQAVHHAPFATMALVHGPCYGAAADLVSSCMHRIATADARFRMPGLRFGITLGTRRLAELVGKDKVRQMLETSATFSAEAALDARFLTAIADQRDWPQHIENATKAATELSADAHRLLLKQTVPDLRDADLAALVRSAAEPGLKNRITDFLDSLKSQKN